MYARLNLARAHQSVVAEASSNTQTIASVVDAARTMRTDTATNDDVRRCRRRKRRSTTFVTASVLAVVMAAVFATCPTPCNGAAAASPLFVWTPASESLRDDVRALRCYAAVAKEANRILVLSDFGSSTNPALGSALAGVVATPSAVTNFVVPSFAGGTTWREWRNGDDVRMKKRDTRWCLELAEGTNATEAVEALGKRYRNDRPACARLSTRASETCGDDVEMVLTSKVDSMETLPDGLLEMLSDGSVKRNVVANALSEHMASKEKDAEDAASSETTRDGESEPAPQPESASTSTSSASGVDAESSLTQVAHRAHRASQVERVHMNERVADAGMPKFEYASAAPRLVSKSKSADASRALIFFGLSVAVVGFFINSFGFAHQARRRDELAALIIDPTRVKIEATQSPRRDERV